MRWLLALVALALGAFLQASALNSLLPVHLDPLLVMVVAWGVVAGPREGALFGFAAGAFGDLVGGHLMMTLPKLLIGWIAGTTKPLMPYRQLLMVLPLVALFTVVQESIVMAGYFVAGKGLFLQHLTAILGPESLGNAVITWPLYALVRWGLRRTQDRFGQRAESLV